ncbi:hypothetical protein CHS0354_025305 [Potamilus streckersoni]|uniref:Uncharacterized protein n=1 Tax=Potamilus streckersoni TaxID=2493646 RepID=A0AAE0RUR0_9BIVA|nr:hypothetical protein CHS0354_025305 [Potamilus streckersoni]
MRTQFDNLFDFISTCRFSSLVKTTNAAEKTNLVTAKIKEYYSHIINGVDLIYREIQDPSISITVTLSGFIFFQVSVTSAQIVSNLDIKQFCTEKSDEEKIAEENI